MVIFIFAVVVFSKSTEYFGVAYYLLKKVILLAWNIIAHIILSQGITFRIVKEARELLVYCGAIYEITYNDHNKLNQSQIGLLFDVPPQDDLDRSREIKILVAPPGIKDIKWISGGTKQSYLDVGYVEQQVGIAHEQTQLLNNNLQTLRKQYGSKHCITSTIHATMGDTLNRVAIEMSKDDPSSKLWDRVQVVVALSRTQFAKYLIFVGRKASTTKALVDVLKIRSQWSDCIEDILALVMVNEENVHRNGQWQIMTQRVYPFRICDVVLPQCRTGYVYFLISLCSRDFT